MASGSRDQGIPSGRVASLVILALLAGMVLPGTGPPTAAPIPSAPRGVTALAGGNATLQCDGMYWAPNVTAWYDPSYCYGHDEPTISYLSNAPGSGRNASFQITLPSSNTNLSQGDFYATIWFGGTVYDPLSLDQQAFLEFQFYPAPPAYTGPNSGAQDCLANGAFNEAWTSGTNDWFACAVVWGIYNGAEENAVNPSPLDVFGQPDSILLMHSGDHLFVNYTGLSPTAPWRLGVVDTTTAENGTIALENSSRHVGFGPFYAQAALGNILDWGASGPGAIAFAYEIGHALNPAIPVDNNDGGCTPGDHACDSYWPGRWGQMGQMELGLPVLGHGPTAGFPLKMYYSSSQEGEAEVNASTSPVGSHCPAPSFSTSVNCLYPWYQYRAGNYSFTFGATDVANATYDYGNEYEFPGFAQADGIAVAHRVKTPWAWLNVTVAPANAQVEVNPRASVDVLPASSSGIYSGEHLEGDYWINASAPGCQSTSRAVYLRSMVNETVGLVLGCPTSATVPVSFLESGLPTGTGWSLDLSGLPGSASGRNITFNVSAGAYTAQPADPVAGTAGLRYVPSPEESVLEVGTSALQEPVQYGTQVELTTAASPAGGGTVTPAGSSWYDLGAVTEVTASAAPGFAFSGWACVPSSACSSASSNPVTVTLNGPATVTADFAPKVPVSFVESGLPVGTSWTMTFNGVASTASGRNITFNVTAGTYPYTAQSPVNGAVGVRYVPSSNNATVTVGSTPLVVPVTYLTQYRLTTGVSPAGAGTVSVPSGAWEGAGTAVSITARPTSGYHFLSWSCSPSSACSTTTGDPVNVTMGSPTSVTATFAVTVPVSFLESGLPTGTAWQVTFDGVISTVSGKNITFNVTAGTYPYTAQSPVNGAAGVRYVPSSNNATVTVGSTPLVVPVTYLAQYRLTTGVSPAGGGTVTPAGTLWENASQAVTLTATPGPGYSFLDWSCDPAGLCPSLTADPITVTVSGPGSVTAMFAPAAVTVSFLEQGLPTGTAWSVLLHGVPGSAQGSNISFNVTAGTYSYTVASPLEVGPGVRYVDPTPSGTVTVSSRPVSIPVTFTPQYRLIVTGTPAGEGNTTPASGWYGPSSPVTLQALPANGYRFTGWTSPNATGYRGPDDPVTLTLTAPVEEGANFAPALTYFVTFQETGIPAGTPWTVTVNGDTQTSSTYTLTFSLTNGSYAFDLAGEVHPGTPGLRYQLSGPSSGTVTVNGLSVTLNVGYTPQVYLTVGGGNGTAGTTSPSSGWYDAGVVVELQATPSPSFVFVQWVGTGIGSYSGPADPTNLTLSQPVNETATFGPAPALVGYVTGTVTPPNAVIVIGGRPVNVSVSGAFNVSLTPGHYLVNATLAGYITYQTTVSVVAGKTSLLTLSLAPIPSSPSSVAGPPAAGALYLFLPPLAIVGLALFAWWRARKRPPSPEAETTGAPGA